MGFLAVNLVNFVVVCACVVGLVAFFVLFIREQKINDKVMTNSQRIKDLLALNQEIQFHDISRNFNVSKHYDNKTNYNKIEPAYLMTGELRANIAYFSDYVARVKENRNKLFVYNEKIKELLQREYTVDYVALELSEKTYLRREKKLFDKQVLLPVVDCAFRVTMTYSSPKGKVNLSKNGVFKFDDMFVCLESVSRARLDKATYSRLAAVERGEVSDSLRYDILNRDNFTCVICGASSKQGARLHVDHIIPIAKGGKSVPGNLRTLCERCNIGKSDKIETVTTEPSKPTNTEPNVCGWCGSKLVLRKGRYGDFYGCVNYPRCNFTQKVEK